MATPSPPPPVTTLRRPPSSPEVADAAAILGRHASNPSAFLALNAETSRFRVPGIDGLIAYRTAGGRVVVQLGGAFADPADEGRLLDEFLAFAAAGRRRVVAIQLLRPEAERYAARGFTVNQIGASYARSLGTFTLKGKPHMQLRNKLSRARRAGVAVSEVGVDVPDDGALRGRLDAVDADWLRSKGRHVKELDFLVGERDGPAAPLRRLFLATDASGGCLAYISFSPVYGSTAGWLHDLSRRRPDAPPGTMELVLVTAIERFREEGAGHLHFGLTPFTSLSADHELAGHSALGSRLVSLLASHGQRIYPAADQLAYKQKWAPDLVQPEYVAFASGVDLRSLWALLRVTNAV